MKRFFMIAINLREKEKIAERYPNIHFVRTMKGDSKRHHYYMEESPGPMRLLRKLRFEPDDQGRKGRGKNRTGKNRQRKFN